MTMRSNPATLPRAREPRLAVAWQPRWTPLSNLGALLAGPSPPRGFPKAGYFSGNWVRGALPLRGVFAAALFHALVIVFPWPHWDLGARPIRVAEAASPNYELTWETPARDLPPIASPKPAARPSPPGEPSKPLPPLGAEAHHPRQIIISAPKLPTHPRQTLVQPEAPQLAPKFLTQLPNIVQWSGIQQPAKPKLQIDPKVLANLRPKAPVRRRQQEVAVPDVPNGEQQIGDLNLAKSELATQKPLMPVPEMSVPQSGPSRAGEEVAAPDVAPNLSAGADGATNLIALSATPAAELKVPVPPGNLQARVTISPEGPQPGSPGGAPNAALGANGNSNGGANSPGGTGAGDPAKGPVIPGITISGGIPVSASHISGLSSRPSASDPSSPLPPHPAASSSLDRKPPSPGFDRVMAGAPPESIFESRKVYTLHINMPNLTSVTGSWILSFVEMPADGVASEVQTDARLGVPPPKLANDLAGPVPLRKVDPKYPPALAQAHVEGEVVLYAIIRRDGSVDSIQVVKGIDPDLDQNAMVALARWKFRPAERQGSPIELEAIVHIPFRSTSPNF